MKISVEISDKELKEVREFTEVDQKGPAIRKAILEYLMIHRRRQLVGEVISGKWRIDLPADISESDKDRSAWQ